MNRTEKAQQVDTLKDEFGSATAVFISDYRGLTATELTELRMELRKSKTNFKVIKNRLALRALEGGLSKDLETTFDDTTAVSVSTGDIAAGAKTLTSFAKTHEKLVLKAGILDGKVISIEEIRALSTLPSREELLAKLLSTWNAVPTGLVRVLNAMPSGWVNVLDALKRKKEEGS